MIQSKFYKPFLIVKFLVSTVGTEYVMSLTVTLYNATVHSFEEVIVSVPLSPSILKSSESIDPDFIPSKYDNMDCATG